MASITFELSTTTSWKLLSTFLDDAIKKYAYRWRSLITSYVTVTFLSAKCIDICIYEIYDTLFWQLACNKLETFKPLQGLGKVSFVGIKSVKKVVNFFDMSVIVNNF